MLVSEVVKVIIYYIKSNSIKGYVLIVKMRFNISVAGVPFVSEGRMYGVSSSVDQREYGM